MSKLLMIVPSRERPNGVEELWQTFRDTASPGSYLCIATDDDDPTNYRPLPGCIMETGPRLGMIGTLNAAAIKYASRFDVIGFAGDDHRFRTKGWDTAYVETIREMGGGIVYGNDLLQGQNLPTQVACSGSIITALGYMVPPELQHMYADNFWRDLGLSIGRLRYLPDVIIEHMHYSVGKSEHDEGYDRVAALIHADEASYAKYQAERFEDDVDRARKAVNA